MANYLSEELKRRRRLRLIPKRGTFYRVGEGLFLFLAGVIIIFDGTNVQWAAWFLAFSIMYGIKADLAERGRP